MRKLLIISYDAVGDYEVDKFMKYPNFSALAHKSKIFRNIDSIFLSNTYPVHTSVVTGLPPAIHGIINNTHPFPSANPLWNYRANEIKAKTLWQAANEKGLSVATIMWPVTGGAKEIKYNIPELLIQPNENQIIQNLKYGSKLMQLQMYIKYRHLLQGINQPALDNFSVACMTHILKSKKPHLALIHLTAYDSLCHHYGFESEQLNTAIISLDKNLGQLLKAAGPDYDVIIFSDHGQLSVHNEALPNEILINMGLLHKDKNGHYIKDSSYFECCGGTAFFHCKGLSDSTITAVKNKVQSLDGFNRFLRYDEMAFCGRKELAFGFAAKNGWIFSSYTSKEKANHGYPIDYENYKVFYMVNSLNIELVEKLQCLKGTLLDIAPIAATLLNIEMDFNIGGFYEIGI